MSQLPSKKKHKKKKKPLTEINNTTIDNTQTKNETPVSINEVLPHQVGMKTVFNDVEVTMTHNGENNKVVTSSKKKKKKKSKQLAETIPETKSDNNQDFIKFGEDRIELINHPEISVTIANPKVSIQEPSKLEKEKKSTADKEEPPSSVVVQTESKRQQRRNRKKEAQTSVGDQKQSKKKGGQKVAQGKDSKEVDQNCSKKKDKNKTQEVTPVAPTAVGDSKSSKKKKKKSNATDTDSVTIEDSKNDPSAPTYVKLPAAGDNCVLLVSHESFSSNNKVSVTTSDTVTITSKSDTVLVKRRDLVEPAKNSGLSPVLEPQPAVSIFPVIQAKVSNHTKEGNTDFDVNNSLHKVSDMVNKKIESDVKDSVSGVAQETALSKAQLKAERRAKQEAQRAAKLAKVTGQEVPKQVASETSKSSAATPSVSKDGDKKLVPKDVELAKEEKAASVEKTVPSKSNIFSHLPQWKPDSMRQLSNPNLNIHPSIIQLGFHYVSGLRGSNARCVGFLAAFQDVIRDYRAPPADKELAKDLESKLSTYLKFLDGCRPLSVSVSNSVRFLRHQIAHLPRGASAEEGGKETLRMAVADFVREEVLLAREAICTSAAAKISHGDNVLVYAYSSLVLDALRKAHAQGRTFRVLVADSRTGSDEGLQMLRRLRESGLRCSFLPSGSASIVMKTVSKVMVGAHALLSNGSVMSRAGCKEVALFASYYNVPVLVCCETYKFCDRALTDSCVHNELGPPGELVRAAAGRSSEALRDALASLRKCNVLYDITPSDLIAVVITEKGLLPTTSVPVVLRVKHAGWQE